MRTGVTNDVAGHRPARAVEEVTAIEMEEYPGPQPAMSEEAKCHF